MFHSSSTFQFICLLISWWTHRCLFYSVAYNPLQLFMLLLKLPDLLNKSPLRLVSASIWHVPIIHWACPCFLAQFSGPELLVFSLPHIWGIFMDPFEWRMAVSYQDLTFNVFIAIGCLCSQTPWIELENICMLHIHLNLYLFICLSIHLSM